MKAHKSQQVEEHFHRISKNWDEIYTGQGSNLYNWLNKKARKGVYNRAKRVLEIVNREAKQVNTALDVGCGSGAIALQLAKENIQVTGIDFAENMIALCSEYAMKYKIENRCFFIHGDFIKYDFDNQTFDASIAMGVLDYVANPQEFLERMTDVSRYMIMATFPIKGTVRSYFRRIRLYLNRCPVYFYSKKELDSLLLKMRFSRYTIERVNNQYFVVAHI